MLIPVKWLKEFVATSLSGQAMADRMLNRGLETTFVKNGGEEFLEVDILPNRGDCLSVYGVAREAAAMIGAELKPLPKPKAKPGDRQAKNDFKLEINDLDLCPCYLGRIVRGVKIGPSPDWLVKRLVSAGVRSINNVVDITNYILLEMGQPLHAFDLSTLKGQKIIVRRAKAGEKMATLDGKERTLTDQMLVIADSARPVAIAGIMGGGETEVSDKTVDIFLESAYFKPASILRTSRELGLRTEAAARFSKSVDPLGVEYGLEAAASLFEELAGGQADEKLFDVSDEKWRKAHDREITLRPARFTRFMGYSVPVKEMTEILSQLQFKVSPKGDDLLVKVPSFRLFDVQREADLIEEVARIYGYEKIPTTVPAVLVEQEILTPTEKILRKIYPVCLAAGLTEVVNYPMRPQKDAERLSLSPADKSKMTVLANPLSEEQSVLRTSIIPGLLENCQFNRFRQIEDVNIFETGNVFLKGTADAPEERCHLGLALIGNRGQGGWSKDRIGAGQADFFSLKGIAENIFVALKLLVIFADPKTSGSATPFLHPGQQAGIVVSQDKRVVGYLGQVHPDSAAKFDLKEAVYILEIDLDEIAALPQARSTYKPLPDQPASRRDIALVVSKTVSNEQIEQTIRSAGGDILENVQLFDLYSGQPIEEGYVSLAYALTYRQPTRTLTDEEINNTQQKIIQELGQKLGAKIR